MKANKLYLGFKYFLVCFSCLFLLNTVLPEIFIINHDFAIESSDMDEKEAEEKNEELKEKLQVDSPILYQIVFFKDYNIIDKVFSQYLFRLSERCQPVLNPPPDLFLLI